MEVESACELVMGDKKQHFVGLAGDSNIEHYRRNERRVRTIRIAIQAIGPPWPNSRMNDNHVYVLLLLSTDSSIQVNMRTDDLDDDRKGILVWEKLPYQASNNTARYLDVRFTKDIKVKRIYSHIRERSLHRYQFSGGGSGCHYWV